MGTISCTKHMFTANSFCLGMSLAEVPVTFALCKHTILNSCVGLCALLNMVVPIVWQQYRWTS